MTLLVTLCTVHDWIISDCRNSFNNKLKNYEQAKNFFNPENTQSSSEESFKEKRKTFIRMCSFSHTEFMSWRFHNPLKYLKWCVLQKQLTVKSCQLFSQHISCLTGSWIHPWRTHWDLTAQASVCYCKKCFCSFANNSKSKQN